MKICTGWIVSNAFADAFLTSGQFLVTSNSASRSAAQARGRAALDRKELWSIQ